MERQVTAERVVQAGLNTLKASIYVCVPGSVVTYYPATQTADVQPMTNDVRFDVDTGAIVYEPWSVIYAVPVAWPRFGGFCFAGPLAAQDPVVLQAFDLDPNPWRAEGRSRQPSNPADVRRHGGNYWRAIPTDLTGPMRDASAAGGVFVIGKDGDAAQIRFSAGILQLGASGGDFVALASKVATELSKIQATLLTGTSVSGGAVSFGTPYSPAGVASAMIKAQ